jgi:regulator of nonsense transcripts 1
MQAGVVPHLLDTQYRMHPSISQFPSDAFYGGSIKDGITAADRPLPLGIQWPNPKFPVMFIPANNGMESKSGTSQVQALCPPPYSPTASTTPFAPPHHSRHRTTRTIAPLPPLPPPACFSSRKLSLNLPLADTWGWIGVELHPVQK